MSLFNKVAGLQAYNFINKRLQHRCFTVNIAKFIKNTYFEEHLRTAAFGAIILELGFLFYHVKIVDY